MLEGAGGGQPWGQREGNAVCDLMKRKPEQRQSAPGPSFSDTHLTGTLACEFPCKGFPPLRRVMTWCSSQSGSRGCCIFTVFRALHRGETGHRARDTCTGPQVLTRNRDSKPICSHMPVCVHLCLRVCLFRQTGSPSGAGTTTAPSALSRWGYGRSYVLCVSPHELSSLGELIPALSFKSHLPEEDVWGRRRGGVDALTSTPPQISLSHRSFFFFLDF